MKEKTFFKNKYVLVTGASSGIGYQVAKDFLELGCYVGVHYNKNERGAKKLLKMSKNDVFLSHFSFKFKINIFLY